MVTQITSEILLYPCPPETDPREGYLYAVKVSWRGTYEGKHGGGYEVSHLGSSLNATSRKWVTWPERFRVWQFRFKTLEDALAAAHEALPTVTIGGLTWEEDQNR